MYGAFCMHVFTHVFLRFNYLMGYGNTRWLCYTVMLSSFMILKKCDAESHKTAAGCYRIWEKKGDGLSQKRGPSKVQNLSGDNAFFRCSLELFSLVDRV